MKILIPLLFSLFHSNGFASEFYFETDHSLPLVYVNVAFKGGYMQDPDSQNSVTDLMVQLLPRGTKSKTKQQIDLTLDQLGGSINTETRGEYTLVSGSVLAENIGPFLKLLEEILVTPSFREDEFEKLKSEQISEVLEQLNNDQKLLRNKFDQLFFEGHPFAKTSKGRVKEISQITLENINSQYRKIVDQSRMLILASGDASDSAFREFKKNIDQNLNFGKSIDPITPFKQFPEKKRIVIINKPERTQTQISIAQKGVSFNDLDYDALQIANFAFGGGTFLSKLMVELRVKRGWTYGASSSFKMATQPHSWRVSFFPKNSDTPDAIKEALKLIQDLRERGISQTEFDAAKKSMINSAGFAFNTPAKRLDNLMIEKIFNLPEGYFKNMANRISKISLEQVNAALQKFIEPEHIMIGLVGTASISKKPIATALGVSEKDVEVVDYRF